MPFFWPDSPQVVPKFPWLSRGVPSSCPAVSSQLAVFGMPRLVAGLEHGPDGHLWVRTERSGLLSKQ